MMNFLRKHTRTFFFITMAGFLGGTFIGFGSYFLAGKTSSDAVAEVNNVNIPYRTYLKLYNQIITSMHNKKEEVNDDIAVKKKQEALQQLIQEELFWQESKKYGITVSNEELKNDIQNYPSFQREGRFDHMTYFKILRDYLKMTPKEYEESRKKQIAAFKLRYLISQSVQISEPELQFEYARENRGDMKNYEKDHKTFLEKTQQDKAMLILQEWFRALTQSVKVAVHLEEIERGASPSQAK